MPTCISVTQLKLPELERRFSYSKDSLADPLAWDAAPDNYSIFELYFSSGIHVYNKGLDLFNLSS